jgi:hypothetical protein
MPPPGGGGAAGGLGLWPCSHSTESSPLESRLPFAPDLAIGDHGHGAGANDSTAPAHATAIGLYNERAAGLQIHSKLMQL